MKRLWNKLFGRVTTAVQNRFEAAFHGWGARRWLFSAYQDAHFEVNFAQSMEICRKHLDLVSNSPLVQRIRNLKIQFGVGVDGLMVVPNASDPAMDKTSLEAWNSSKSAAWESWARRPELGSNLSLAELTIQWEGMLFDVGNVIVQKTFDDRGRPAIQTIDRLRLATPPDLGSEENKTVFQGIRVDKYGRPTGYYIRDAFETSTYRLIPADQIIHKFRAFRPGMPVGIPEAFSVINLLIDFTDLHIMEMGASKLASEIATVEINPAGEKQTGMARSSRLGINSVNSAGATTSKNVLVDYNVSLGAKNIAMRSGDSLQNFMVNRPTVAQQDYWDFLLAQICIGYNVPKLLVVPYSLQGTVTRADLDVCSTAFRGDFEIIAAVVREIYEWQSGWAVKFDRALDGKVPANFSSCVIRPPRAPNVDVGYTASALALEMEMGVKTLQDVCAEGNKDWRQHLREIAETEAYIDELGEEFGIAPERIAFKNFKSGSIQAAKDTADAAATAGSGEPKEEPVNA